MTRERYSMKNARRRRELTKYAQVITRVARFVDISIYNQIFLIYNELDLEFRRDLSLSSDSTNMNTFLTQMKNKKKIWWALDAKHRDAYIASAENQRNLEDFNRSSSTIFRSSNQGQGQYQYDEYRDDDFDNISYVNQQSRNQFSTFY